MTQEIDFNPEERILCLNENCIGLLSKNGVCTICKKSFLIDSASHENEKQVDVPFGIDQSLKIDKSVKSEEPNCPTDESLLEERLLCNNENCIGLVENKQCKICGTVQ